jgi:hypothetical protein
MYRRVLIPMGIAVWTMVGLALTGAASAMYQKVSLQRITAGRPIHWMLPALPATGCLVFLGVFFAVRLCSLRGGSRRECIAVGLAPLALALIYCLVVAVSAGDLSWPLVAVALGNIAPIGEDRVSIGTAMLVRTAITQLLGLAATCLSATWLWFFVSGQQATTQTSSLA